MRLRNITACAPLLLAALSAHGMPRHVDVVLEPSQVHEECVSLQRGQRIQYRFTLDPPGDFRLVYRNGKKVVNVLRDKAASERNGTYAAPAARKYCLVWHGSRDRSTRLGYEFVVVEPGTTKY